MKAHGLDLRSALESKLARSRPLRGGDERSGTMGLGTLAGRLGFVGWVTLAAGCSDSRNIPGPAYPLVDGRFAWQADGLRRTGGAGAYCDDVERETRDSAK